MESFFLPRLHRTGNNARMGCRFGLKLNFSRCGPIRCPDLGSGRPSLSSLRFRNAVQRIDFSLFPADPRTPRRVVAGSISQGLNALGPRRLRGRAAWNSTSSPVRRISTIDGNDFRRGKPVCCHNIQSPAGSQRLRSCSTLTRLRSLKGRTNSERPAHRTLFASAGPTFRDVDRITACLRGNGPRLSRPCHDVLFAPHVEDPRRRSH